MSHKRLLALAPILVLVLVSLIVLGSAIIAMVCLPTERSSALGSLIGGAAGMLAVIWFSASLYYQSKQLKEQRQQFFENFHQLIEDNRRNSLVLVRDILSRAEEKALKSNPELTSFIELKIQYIKMSNLQAALTSTDPQTVLKDAGKWLKTIEGPALTLMTGIKFAAEIYFRATGKTDINYTLEPEIFVRNYAGTLCIVPYFEEYIPVALTISNWMVNMKSVRAAVDIAYWVAAYKGMLIDGVSDIIDKNRIIEDVKNYKKAGYALPAIAEGLLDDPKQLSFDGYGTFPKR